MSSNAEAAYQDPTVDTISPWLWLPPTLILLYALLWYSLRRDHFIETYYRAIDYLQADLLPRLPCWPSSHPPSRHIRLSPHDLDHPLLDDDDSDDDRPSPSHSGAPPYSPPSSDAGDELPTSSHRTARSRRVGTWYLAGIPLPPVRAAAHRVLDTLGWTRTDGGPGLARALWGTREGDRLGRIKLGELSGVETGHRRESGDEGGGAGLGAMWGRVTDLAGAGSSRDGVAGAGARYDAIPSAPRPKSAAVSHHLRAQGGDDLFSVGEEVDEGAVELPADFTLSMSPADGRGQ